MEEEKPTISKEPSPETIAQFVNALVQGIQSATHPKEVNFLYANSTHFEVSAWDLKMFFGQLDQRTPKGEIGLPSTSSRINWHTSMSIPWTQAKIFEYYLRLNLLFYEKKFGPIWLPQQVIPIAPLPPTEEQKESDPQAVELWEAYKKVYDQMFGEEYGKQLLQSP